jgi:hypothetical protein
VGQQRLLHQRFYRLASSLGKTGGIKYFTLSSSNPYPSFDIPLFLPVTGNPDFVSSSSFTQGVGIYEYNNFTISTGHQMTLNPGVTIIRCAGTFTCGGNGIIGALGEYGDVLTVGDGYTKTSGTNATGTGAWGGGGAGGSRNSPVHYGGNAINGGAGGGGAGSGGDGSPATETQGGTGGISLYGTTGAPGGINGLSGKPSGCLIVIANVINISSNITLTGGGGQIGFPGNNGNFDTSGSLSAGGGGSGGGAGGRGGQGGIFIGLGNTINHSSGVINVSGGNGGNGGDGGDGRVGNQGGDTAGGGAGPGGPGGDIGFVYLKAKTLTASGTITANVGNPGNPGTPGNPSGANNNAGAGYNAGTSTVGRTYVSIDPLRTITGDPF